MISIIHTYTISTTVYGIFIVFFWLYYSNLSLKLRHVGGWIAASQHVSHHPAAVSEVICIENFMRFASYPLLGRRRWDRIPLLVVVIIVIATATKGIASAMVGLGLSKVGPAYHHL